MHPADVWACLVTSLGFFKRAEFPEKELVGSLNAYLGAFPIATALGKGADIVLTGRCVDSAVTLGACINAFKWAEHDLDALAGGSLAGHSLECSPQAIGGNFPHWRSIADNALSIGYPWAEVSANSDFVARKPEFLPYIWHAFDAYTVQSVFAHFDCGRVERFMLPGINAMNHFCITCLRWWEYGQVRVGDILVEIEQS